MATFTTIYPGWYPGRAVHIHFKVRPTASTVFTSQLFFDDALSDQVFTQAPYAGKGKRDRLEQHGRHLQSTATADHDPDASGVRGDLPNRGGPLHHRHARARRWWRAEAGRGAAGRHAEAVNFLSSC